MASSFFAAVDVGSSSVRAAIFDTDGKRLSMAIQELKTWRPQENFVEQSSEDIWTKACAVVKKAVSEAGVRAEQVIGIGFDATCSLVALEDKFKPVTVSPSGSDEQNVIVWMDHRANKEAAASIMYSAELSTKHALDAIQVLGGYGYMKEYPIAKYFLDCRVDTIFGGTTEIMKEIIGRSLGV